MSQPQLWTRLFPSSGPTMGGGHVGSFAWYWKSHFFLCFPSSCAAVTPGLLPSVFPVCHSAQLWLAGALTGTHASVCVYFHPYILSPELCPVHCHWRGCSCIAAPPLISCVHLGSKTWPDEQAVFRGMGGGGVRLELLQPGSQPDSLSHPRQGAGITSGKTRQQRFHLGRYPGWNEGCGVRLCSQRNPDVKRLFPSVPAGTPPSPPPPGTDKWGGPGSGMLSLASRLVLPSPTTSWGAFV